MRALVVLLGACALTSRSAPLELRYFTLPIHASVAPAERLRVPLRIGHVVPSGLLRTRIVHRDSDVELAPYETLRWADEPDAYVRRAVTSVLYAARPASPAGDGAADTLDLEVLAFEEVRHGDARSGRVELRYQVRDAGRLIAQGTVVAERAARGGIEAVVVAIGAALDAAAADLASRLVAAMARADDAG